MKINGVEIEDTYAEAFIGFYSRLLITAVNERWARAAATEMTGYGTSIIGCSAETGIEKMLPSDETPDGRPGCVVQVWASRKKMIHELLGRIGQCVLTAPTTAVWNYSDSDEKLDVGYKMRFFGDGFEEIKNLYGRDVVSIPITMGEFMIEKEFGIGKGVAGGNFLIQAKDQKIALQSGEKAAEAIAGVEGAITPFPRGVNASGSKVGSRKYRFMRATTNEAYCPTLRDKGEGKKILGDVNSVVEIVIDGISTDAIKEAMQSGIMAATDVEGVRKITAANYGGKLGDIRINLHDLFK